MDKQEMHERIINNLSLFCCAFLLALCLLCFDGGKVGFFKKFAAPEDISISSTDDTEIAAEFRKHEAFLLDHIGFAKTHIILSGSCELLSIWAEKQFVNERFSIAHQLEDEFIAHGVRNVRVLNLSMPLFMAGHNLHTFLRFLDDPRDSIFVWHNEFSPTFVEANKMSEDTFIYEQLILLHRRFPQIIEISELLKTRFKTYSGKTAPQVADLQPPFITSQTLPDEIERSFFDTLQYLRKHLFRSDQNEQFKKNTLYLREFRARLTQYLDIETIPPSVEEFRPLGWQSDSQDHPKMYLNTPAIQKADALKVNRDSILTLRLMGQLAQYCNKSIYVYFGPEGNARNQESGVYDREYKIPIVHALQDIKSIHIMDLTDLPILEGVDSWSQANLTYSGNKKVASKMFEIIYANEHGRFF